MQKYSASGNERIKYSFLLSCRAYKFELKAKVRERILFAQFAGCCRLVWNKALAIQKELLDKKEKLLSYNKIAKKLVFWKQ
ncbi:MAG: helix-turn-helix domain-containing protein, partial [Prochloraceae cyanobacterium]